MSAAPLQESVLLVEDSPQLFNEIKSLMAFMGYDTVYTSDIDSLNAALDSREFTAILLGALSGESAQRQALDIIDSDAAEQQVILINQPVEQFDKYRQLSRSVVAHLDMPLRFEPVMEALGRAREFYDRNRQEGSATCRKMLGNVPKLVGQSPAMQYVRTMIEQVAKTDASVLILGESGTGKEVVARNVHALSARCKAGFVPVNCGAIPGDLLESELFGHEKGAFTGAISARQGRFELAEKGTLFLDEIGDMSLPMQVKLLRVLQERTFERVGSNKSMTADVRILAATHRDLENNIRNGKFREDLFYRLNVFPIELPSLRERLEDVRHLLQHQIERLEREKRGSVNLADSAVEALSQYQWPGNVRELANLVERLTILFPGGTVQAKDLPPKYVPRKMKPTASQFNPAEVFATSDEEDAEIMRDTSSFDGEAAPRNDHANPFTDTLNSELPIITEEGLDLKEHLAQLEVELIKQALDATQGIVAHAAKLLKMRRTTLVEKLKKYGISAHA